VDWAYQAEIKRRLQDAGCGEEESRIAFNEPEDLETPFYDKIDWKKGWVLENYEQTHLFERACHN